MRGWQAVICGITSVVLAGGGLFAGDNTPANAVATGPAVYVPDTAHQNDPLPDGVLAWDGLTKETNAAADAEAARFTFNFTNVSPGQVVILSVYPGCSCTTFQLPPLPWILPPGSTGQFGVTVNLAGKTGLLFKAPKITTDRGFKQLMLKITILPPVMPTESEADRAHALEIAKADRQVVFRGDCMACHVKPGEGKYGKSLYDTVCAICHEGEHRSSLVPDLHNIITPTNLSFWQTWIAHGKAGSLMPAFSTSDGGPLSDIQITSLAQYLALTIPSQLNKYK